MRLENRVVTKSSKTRISEEHCSTELKKKKLENLTLQKLLNIKIAITAATIKLPGKSVDYSIPF